MLKSQMGQRGFALRHFLLKALSVSYFTDYDELKKYMDRLGLFHMDLTLDRMQRFWDERGVPDIPVVHVVGTNGKGSTTTFLCSIARAHGLKTGQFVSPHFLTPRERVLVNRSMLSRETWVELGNEIMATPGGDALTYFEFHTCLAMLAFEKEKVEFAIMEAGLGGRFDATNVFAPRMTLFTPIGMDHEKVLGPTITDIACDKAGAIQPRGLAVTGIQVAEAMIPLQERAEEVGARLMYAVDMADPIDNNALGMMGIHQTANGRLALAAWRWYSAATGNRSVPEAERFGLESAFLPGRMQMVEVEGRTIILDGAHNPPALDALGSALAAEEIRPSAVVFACFEDKDVSTMLDDVKGFTNGPIIVPTMESERAMKAHTLSARFGDRGVVVDSMKDALARASETDGVILVCGSLYLLAEFYALYPEFLTPNS